MQTKSIKPSPAPAEKEISAGRDAGTGIRYIAFGRGDKPMVIVPGLSLSYVTDSAEALAAAFADFTDDYTVYVFDVREQVPPGYSLRDMGEDLTAAIQALGLQGIYLYGCSMGGMTSLYVAGKYPELVAKVAVCASACRITEPAAGIFRRWIRLAEAGETHPLTADMGRLIYSEAVFEASEAAFAALADGLTEPLLTRFIHTASAMTDADVSEKAGAVRCPILVLGSQGDKIMTAAASEEIAAVTGGELFLYGEAYPHAVYDEAPDFRSRVKAFFDRPRLCE